ncbi:MAG: Fe-S cluster assembly protein SufD [Gammaproteobacteria bacterium]|nr:Fe-S cluster assembly protein SufD [Gammaproteobacteria bacterium]
MNSPAAHYLEQCRALADSGVLPGQAGWLQAQRRAALAHFEEVGFPTQRDEDWRYTSIRPMTAKLFHAGDGGADARAITPAQIQATRIDGMKSHRLVFIDGLFAEQYSDSTDSAQANAGVTVAPLARILDESPERIEHALGTVAPRRRHGFTALNHAGARDGAVVLVEAGARPALPVEMLFISAAEDGLAQPRNLVIAGAGGKVSLIERHLSANAHNTLTNSATEIALFDDAQVDYHLIQAQSTAAHHVCGVWARQARNSRFSCRSVTVGGRLVRNDLGAELAGEHAHCDLFGLYAAAGAQHVDNHTTITHAAAECSSREVYKGVLEQRARAVFHGRIVVAKGAQKTDATQANNNLLLSRGAEIDTKPQLEIDADDVKCAHGATVGQLDADALFYLRARGVSEEDARRMLTFAFANDIIDKIAVAELKDALVELLAQRLAGGIDNGGATADARASINGESS